MTGDVINLEIKGRSVELQASIDAANLKAKELKKTIAEIEKDGGKGSENWQKYKNELKASQEQAAKLSKELKTLDISKMTIRQLEIHAKDLAKELKNADRSSQEFSASAKRLKDVDAELLKARNQAKGLSDEAEKLAKPGIWVSLKGYIANAFAISTVDRMIGFLIDFGKEAVLNAAKATDAFGGIKKAIDGITPEEIITLNKEISKIDTRTAQEELLTMAQVGGQIGVAKEEMLGFVESVDMAAVALGDEFSGGAEEVATKLGVISKIFKETKDLKAGEAISRIGSAINDLGAAGSATGPVIADFTTRMGALGSLSPQISQTLGLGAAFQELGLSSEIAASGLKNILNGAATSTKAYADQIGYTEEKFKELINSSPNDVILKLAQSFKGLPVTEVARQMNDLGIKSNEAKSVMSLLANETKLVTDRQAAAASAMELNTSLTAEFNTMNTTAAAELAKAGKSVDTLKMQLGTFLLPILTQTTKGFMVMVQAVSALPEFIKENQKAFTALGVAILALNGNSIRAAASTIAHSAAETARTVVAKASAIAQNVQLIALVAMEGATKKATTASYASIVAEKLRTTTTSLVTSAQTALRAITTALTIENIKNTASSTAQSIAEKSRALVTRSVTAAQTTLRAITSALTLENIRSTASAAAHTLVEKGRTLATNAVAVAQGLLNAVMRANPIGVVITLAAALVAGFMKWYDSSQTLRAGMAGLWGSVKAVGTVIADVWGALTSLDFEKVASIIASSGKTIAKSFTDGYNEKIKEEAPKTVAIHKSTQDKKAEASRLAAEKIAEVENEIATKSQTQTYTALEKGQDKNHEKLLAKKAQQLEDFRKAEESYEQQIARDREKALELAAQMEAENDQAIAETTLQIEEVKILEKARKRRKEIQDSTIDEQLKQSLLSQIENNAQIAISQKKDEFREKQAQKDEEAAKRKLETESFIRDQEQAAELVLLDWKENQAKGNSTKIIAIKKERLDTELRFLKQNLQAEMEEEKLHASSLALNDQQLEATLQQIEDRYRIEGLLAVKKNSEDKLALDKEYHNKKVENLKAFSGVLGPLLKGDLGTMINHLSEMLAVSKKGDEDRAASFMQNAERTAAFAQSAVNFLNGLAQAKAEKAIALAKREMEEKVAILQQEIAVTDSLIKSSSEYISNLKEEEKNRLTELQNILTSETATEEEKRDAARLYYSEKFQQMKEAEEQKIKDLQRLANLAKTDDEKIAIEAKIELAKQESAEKIRLGEEQLAKDMDKVDQQIALEYKLTSETTSEEQKKAMLKEFYSQKLTALKESEEAFIADLQRRANEAKTEDERQAIQAKVEMAKKETAEKIRLAEDEAARKTETLEGLSEFTSQISQDTLAEAEKSSADQIRMAEEEAEQKADFKADLEETIAAENRKARATEQAEKKKAFQAQKKADIATALITGALAVLKALANFFPLNIILAATAAVVTGVQIAKIKNQPDPTFAAQGAVIAGSKHGSSYGIGGIALIDRNSGLEVGEMEGGEAIISADQTEANMPLINKMFANARTPGKSSTPVLQHPATPIAFRDGGVFESPYYERGMYLFGSKKKKAEQAAKDAEAEAAKAQAEADAAMGDMPSFDAGAYGGIDGSTGDSGSPESQAAFEASQKQGQQQLQLLQDIVDASQSNGDSLQRIVTIVGELKGSVNGVEGAVNSVRDAVYNTNTQGKFDALIGAISNMSA